MTIEAILKADIQKAIQKNFDILVEDILLQPTKKEFDGFYTFVTFALTKATRRAPAEIGQIIAADLEANSSIVDSCNVVQGFLNISLNDETWLKLFGDIISDLTYGDSPANGKSVMIEFSSPNTNKPLHLGHLRNDFLGDSLSRILKACGYDVVKTCLVNDRGIHICKSMLAYRELANGETPESSGLKGDHLAGKYYVLFDKEYKKQIGELVENGMTAEEAAKKAPWILEAQKLLLLWEQGDEETVALWKKMNNWVYDGFNQTYNQIGVSFDKTYYESNTYVLGKDIIEEGLQKGVFFKKPDNSVWIDLTAEGLDEKLVLRGDGTSVYITQDIGTTELKFADFHNDRYLWVVGNEQDYHFNVLFAILKRLGRPYADGCYHISYGMVDLPSGKMKSREGTVVDADDLVNQMIETAASRTQELGKIDDFESEEATALYHTLALGALKYYLLKVDPKKRMLFNPEESIDFQGHTGPFIQYTYTRMRSIMRKAEQSGIEIQLPPANYELHQVERELIYTLSQFPLRVQAAGNEFAPSVVSFYMYELAKVYNQFYAEVSIFADSDPVAVKFRVALSKVVSETIHKGLGLLGINVPERM
ncbi:arginine--tRNA ligase [Dyadobacter subterraneus]|uniref:Arginine--tRNA ligase n=1 Tax=Dyadobacter subterraneus TaxID=2773304 RepID=A0ABR9W7S6_9BACT|nr:arginine--tRNA ligase [Dyadobacter subterraneus]MBE9460996.1 arginine--tRNA ligase [Dyadobacter subterraneus]